MLNGKGIIGITTLKGRFLQELRNRINAVLRYNQSNGKRADTEELLGCSLEQVKDWLESQFTEDMTWDAFLAGEIHDHIRPCASFDLTKKSEQLECFNWKNLQPLWAKDNLEKGAKVEDSNPLTVKRREQELINGDT